MGSISALLVVAAVTGLGETVLLEFASPRCSYCQSMEPTWQRLSGERYPVQQIDVERQPELARQYGVQQVPTFVLLSGQREVDRVVGATSYDRLRRMFENVPEAAPNATPQFRGQSPDPPTDAPAQRGVPGGHEDPRQGALAATVRLRVEDAQGHSVGTGTIIDTHGDEALILTCGHLFRDSQGRGRISVELFLPASSEPLPGQLIAYDADERDIALVSIRPPVTVTPVPVAPPALRYAGGSVVFSVGCDGGAAPTVLASRITALDRYAGPPTIEVDGQPADGRSGGGLFSADGYLIGICKAADPGERRGVYAALPTIHWQLKQIGQEQVFMRYEAAVAAQAVPGSSPRVAQADAADLTPVPLPPPLDPRAPVNPANTTAGQDAELFVILRAPDDPTGKSHMMIVKQPSSQLLQQLLQESQQAQSAEAGLPAGRLAERSVVPPVVRAQSR